MAPKKPHQGSPYLRTSHVKLSFPDLPWKKGERIEKRTQDKPNCSSLQLEKPARTQRMSERAALVSSAEYIPEVPSKTTVLASLFQLFQISLCSTIYACVLPLSQKNRINFSKDGHRVRIQHLTSSSFLP